MNYSLKRDLNKVDWSDVADIFRAVSWGDRDELNLKNAFEKSHEVVFAYENKGMIGFGRVISDGEYYAAIYDLIVHPEHQKKGVGSKILKDLISRCPGMIFINLTATLDHIDFYKKNGFVLQNSAMFLPAHEKQREMFSAD